MGVKKNSLKPGPGNKPFGMAGKGGGAYTGGKSMRSKTSTPAPMGFSKGGRVSCGYKKGGKVKGC